MNLVLAQEQIITWAAVVTALGILTAAAWKPFKSVKDFLAHWNGAPERKDWSGKVIAPAKPGMLAMIQQMNHDLAEVRSQVKNHHSTNLRDDVTRLQKTVDHVDQKLGTHIDISKKYDKAQEDTARKLEAHMRETDPLIKRLHDKWGNGDQSPDQ